MHIGIAGPIEVRDVAHLLNESRDSLPCESAGATVLTTVIENYVRRGHVVSAFTADSALTPEPGNFFFARKGNFSLMVVPRRRHALKNDRGISGRMVDLFGLERAALTRGMEKARPEIVHAHWSYEFAMAAISSRLPHLITCHDSPWAVLKTMPNLYRLGRLIMAKSVFRSARNLTVVSPYLVSELRSLTRSSLDVIPNPLPAEMISKGRKRSLRSFADRPPRILMILNGWSSRKNGGRGMEALSLVSERFPGASLIICGPDYGVGEAAELWAQKHGLPGNFIFRGRVPHAGAIAMLEDADLLLHPAVEESFGMAISEAMALGVPVVAGAESGAVPWVLDYPNNLVNVKRPDDMARRIVQLLSQPGDYEQSSEHGLRRVRHLYTEDQVCDAYLSKYREVLRKEGGGA